MGVGVYSSDFDGAGTTFLVSGPLAQESDYKDYCKESEDPVDYGTWSTDEYDDFNTLMIEAIEGAARELDFSIAKRRGFDARRARFDSEFVSIAYDGLVELGWRSWEHGFVVAAAGDGQWQEWMGNGGEAEEFVASYARDPQKAKPIYSERMEAVAEYMRLTLMKSGIETRFRTSGYTTDAYAAPEDVAARKAELVEIVKRTGAELRKEFLERIASSSREDRVSLVAVIDELRMRNISVLVPLYNVEDGVITSWDVLEDDIVSSHAIPDGLQDYLASLPATDGLAPIPRDERTEDFFRNYFGSRRSDDKIVVSVSEYEEGTGSPLSVSYSDGGIVLVEFPSQLPSESAPAP